MIRARGFLLPMVILGILSLAFLAVFIHSLGSGYSSQVQHVGETERGLLIAESVFAEVLARLRDRPFTERFFAGSPFESLDQPLLGGTYDLFVEDAPALPLRFDVYVRSTCGRARRLYFWRVRHEDSVLDATGRAFPIIFAELEADRFPTKGGSPFAEQIRTIMAERSANAGPAAGKAVRIVSAPDLPAILGILQAVPPGSLPTVFELPNPPMGLIPPPPVPPVPPMLPALPTLPPATPAGTGTGSGTGTGTGTGGGAMDAIAGCDMARIMWNVIGMEITGMNKAPDEVAREIANGDYDDRINAYVDAYVDSLGTGRDAILEAQMKYMTLGSEAVGHIAGGFVEQWHPSGETLVTTEASVVAWALYRRADAEIARREVASRP